MAGNTFGQLFRVTTFGESHGLALGAIVDGCPPGMELSESDLQGDLDRRKPGTSRFTTQRREDDAVKILSGVFEGKTTGTSIGLLIENTDQRSKDYSDVAKACHTIGSESWKTLVSLINSLNDEVSVSTRYQFIKAWFACN